MSKKQVLVVDDEQSILTLLDFNLQKEGYAVDTAQDGQEAFDKAVTGKYDFIILDLMLPQKNGIDVCRELRQEKIDTPILMLTAKGEEVDKILGLEMGADDYMTKPFSPREVIARMNAIFRRIGGTSEEEPEMRALQVGEITIYPDNYEVIVRGEPIELTPKEFELLYYMAYRKGKTISRSQLLNSIWEYDFTGGTRIVDVHISHLREKIEKDSKNPEYIQTVRGFGYRLRDVDAEAENQSREVGQEE